MEIEIAANSAYCNVHNIYQRNYKLAKAKSIESRVIKYAISKIKNFNGRRPGNDYDIEKS
jgi:hypothetical protein